LPTSILLNGLRPARPPEGYKHRIYVQPLDEQDPEANHRNLIACREVCLQHGYTLCLQLHKIAGLP
jgi:organic radical activating enzyme